MLWWRRTRRQGGDDDQSAELANDPTAGMAPGPGAPCLTPWAEARAAPEPSLVSDSDWSEIELWLAGAGADHSGAEDSPEVGPVEAELVCELGECLRQLKALAEAGAFLSAVQVTDELLGLWAPAHAVAPDVARPAEEMLSALVGRQVVSAAELRSVCELTEVCLAVYR